MCVVAAVEVVLADAGATTNALSHIVTRHLQVNTTCASQATDASQQALAAAYGCALQIRKIGTPQA